MNRILSVNNLMSVFPYALIIDEDKEKLATVTAEELVRLYEDNRLLDMYSRIDELDEPLLDILAYDFKVDWYLYDGTLQSKREQIKSHFDVHKHLGTKAATVRALNDLYPGTLIEEWYEYGGRPYCFRVLLDISDQLIPISESTLTRLINIFKPVRSIMELGSISLRSHIVIEMATRGGYAIYSARLCGTYPQAARQGHIGDEIIEAAGAGGHAGYSAVRAGRVNAGTYPAAAVQGAAKGASIDVSYDNNDIIYAMPKTGDIDTGTIPQAAEQGAISDKGISFEATGGTAAYNVRSCGTPLDSLI